MRGEAFELEVKGAMSVMIKWLLFLNEIFVIAMVLLAAKWDGKWKGHRLFSVTLPSEASNNEDLNLVLTQYKREINMTAIIAVILSILEFNFKFSYVVIEITLFLLILCAVIASPMILYARAHKRIEQIKVRNGWEAGAYHRGIHEDDFWKYGIFYNNPHDSSRMVNKRMGIGSTMNLAHPGQKKIFIATNVFIILTLLGVTVGLGFMEIKEPDFHMDHEYLYIDYPFYYYKVSTKEITSLQMISEVERGSKINGIDTDQFMRGFFNIPGYGEVYICAYTTGPCLVIQSNDIPVIINEKNAEETYELMEALDYMVPEK